MLVEKGFIHSRVSLYLRPGSEAPLGHVTRVNGRFGVGADGLSDGALRGFTVLQRAHPHQSQLLRGNIQLQ